MTGILCMDKDAGITSFGLCKAVSGLLGEKKCGHTGTLDPMATGLMLVLMGGATRFAEYIPDTEKRYRASFLLGKTTDTYDITGKLTAEHTVHAGQGDVENILPQFTGKIMQTPPMYSAVSQNGQRLYKLARAGVEVERQQRQIEIKQLKLVGVQNGEYTIDVTCSRGTYIRTLIDDIGRALGCGAVMSALRRTHTAGFSVDSAITLNELRAKCAAGESVAEHILPVDSVLKESALYVSEKQARRFQNGGALDCMRIKQPTQDMRLYKLYADTGQFLGLGQAVAGEIRVKKVFVNK